MGGGTGTGDGSWVDSVESGRGELEDVTVMGAGVGVGDVEAGEVGTGMGTTTVGAVSCIRTLSVLCGTTVRAVSPIASVILVNAITPIAAVRFIMLVAKFAFTPILAVDSGILSGWGGIFTTWRFTTGFFSPVIVQDVRTMC